MGQVGLKRGFPYRNDKGTGEKQDEDEYPQ
ncbi:MAG: hypothetical protein JWO06_825 [Bacteroidota bacterium]|nr:hypothetical protein [Bacteroidota bacterium]